MFGIGKLFRSKKPSRRPAGRAAKYLIEFRFHGRAKMRIRELREAIARNYGARIGERKEVPHITLVGPIYTTNEKRLINEVQNTVKKYTTLPSFRLSGFGVFEGRAIFINIEPSEELIDLRNELVKKLEGFCRLPDHDHGEYRAHSTLLLNTHFPRGTDIRRKFDDIMKYLESWSIPNMRQSVLRITVLNGASRIACEFDLVFKRTLDRKDALDRDLWRRTIDALKEQRPDHPPTGHRPEPIVEDSRPGRVFVASDLHFDHENIIRFCGRPFRSAREMNRAMLDNWNRIVSDGDRVYYLGDLTYGRGRKPIDYWLSKMNGEIRFIRGNHDTDIITRAEVIRDRFPIRYRGRDFLLMHDPYRPPHYEGWIIHGDKHNNQPDTYPHVNNRNKTVNVCAEFTGYAPMSLDDIISRIER